MMDTGFASRVAAHDGGHLRMGRPEGRLIEVPNRNFLQLQRLFRVRRLRIFHMIFSQVKIPTNSMVMRYPTGVNPIFPWLFSVPGAATRSLLQLSLSWPSDGRLLPRHVCAAHSSSASAVEAEEI